jgi:hypothetical protein
VAYNVFIERAQDPGNVRGVAQAIADRYGMPADAIAQRMAAGRFRVKGGVDLQTAQRFAADLERLGAVCAIVDTASAEPPAAQIAAPTTAAAPPPMPARPKVARPKKTEVLPPVARSKPPAPKQPTSPLGAAKPVTVTKEDADYQSGLAAAYGATPNESSPDLGALGEESASFSLSALDGTDDDPELAPASSMQPVAGEAGPEQDLFAPPDAQPGGQKELELAVDLTTPPPDDMPSEITGVGVEAPEDAGADQMLVLMDDGPAEQSARHALPPRRTPSGMSIPPLPAAEAKRAPKENPLVKAANTISARPRVKFASGVLVALLLGFLPAHVIASVQEDYSDIDEEVIAEQKRATTVEEWSSLKSYRDEALDQKRARKMNIAVKTGFAWVLVSGLLGYVWIRVVPWDRWDT